MFSWLFCISLEKCPLGFVQAATAMFLTSLSSLVQDFIWSKKQNRLRDALSPGLGQHWPPGSKESQMSGHCPQGLATQNALTSSGHLRLMFPSSQWPRWTHSGSTTSTLCPHHTTFCHTSGDEVTSLAAAGLSP